MADNITLNSGTGGATLAADDVSSVWYQRVKLVDGTDEGTTTIASGNGTSTNALRVTVSSDSTGVLSVDDNGANLSVDFGGTAPTLNTGTVDAGTLRVTLATDDTVTVDNGGTFAVQAAVDELPAAAALTDNFANPTTSQVGSMGMVWDGSTWDRMPGTSADGVTVNLGSNNDVTVTGTVDLGATDNAVLDQIEVNTSYGDNTGNGTAASSLRVTIASDSTGQVALAASDGTDIGDVDVASIAAGSALIGDVGLSGARTSGGTTLYKNIDVDETEDQIKATAGQLYWLHAVNLTASPLYLKFYNATAATVVVGTTTPDLTLPIPTQGDTNGAGFTLSIPNGIAFGTAMTVACTTGIADNDSGAPAANACAVNLGYA